MAKPEYKQYNQVRASKSGMNADLQKKMIENYSLEAEQLAKQWVEEVIGESCEEAFADWLRDGTILSQLMNTIQPGSVPIPKQSTMPFKQMECINLFLIAAEKYGIKKTDLFVTLDLYEDNNPAMVISTLRALDRLSHVRGFQGPTYAPKQSEYNPRDFSEEKISAGKTIIGAQYGYVTGASQKGLTAYGRRRDIHS